MQYHYHTFSSGLRLVFKQVKNPVAHIGITVNTGSRHEPENLQGICHLIEHLIFKGTATRNNFRILSRLEDVGADLNAFTTKEDTTVYVSISKTYMARAVELLSDIMFNSVFPEDEIAKEKSVVLDEINSYKDNPAEWIHDEFEDTVFAGHPLGRNILGTRKSLKSIKRNDLLAFYKSAYRADNMVVSVVAQAGFDHIIKLIGTYFDHTHSSGPEDLILPSFSYVPFNRSIKYSKHISHALIGNIGYSSNQPERFALALLNNFLGGPAMNARLNILLREQMGIAYNIESSYSAFSDTGLFSIYYGTDNENLQIALDIILKELADCRTQKWSAVKLARIRRQAAGQQVIALQNSQNEMLAMARSMTLYGKVDSYKELIEKIENVSAAEILETANKVFEPSQLSYLFFTDREK